MSTSLPNHETPDTLTTAQPPAPSPDPTLLPHSSLDSSTLALHADSELPGSTDVAPPIHMSTTFQYATSPSDLIPARDHSSHSRSHPHIYSRATAPSSTRLETILEPLLHAPTLVYSSGLAALHAAYVFLKPRRVAITGGYHGAYGVLAIHQRLTGLELLPLDCEAEELSEGDVIHLETPVNPTGEARSIRAYAEKAHSRGAILLVDATFGPPGLQEPFSLGADIVMHSGTKYLGGHSDLLCGVLATRNKDRERGLREDRIFLGAVMGGLESWLGVRSLRTLGIRVERQALGAGRLVGWLEEERRKAKEGVVGRVVERLAHSSLQEDQGEWLKEQMPKGGGPVFAIWMRREEWAKALASKLRLFMHATSLGGVESLVEWRAMSDKTVDTRLVRVSIGLEAWEDLRDDLVRAFGELEKESKGREEIEAVGVEKVKEGQVEEWERNGEAEAAKRVDGMEEVKEIDGAEKKDVSIIEV